MLLAFYMLGLPLQCRNNCNADTIAMQKNCYAEKNAMQQSFDLIASCIDKIYTEEEVWATADCTKKEMGEFLESMNSTQFKGIEKFFETMTKLSHTIKVTNPNTKKKSEVVLEGLASFFG